MIQFDYYFQMGWFNHQLDEVVYFFCFLMSNTDHCKIKIPEVVAFKSQRGGLFEPHLHRVHPTLKCSATQQDMCIFSGFV